MFDNNDDDDDGVGGDGYSNVDDTVDSIKRTKRKRMLECYLLVDSFYWLWKVVSPGIKIIAVTIDAKKQVIDPGRSSNPDHIIQNILYWI